MTNPVCVYLGDELGQYAFGEAHPFGPQRYPAFKQEFDLRNFIEQVQVGDPVIASQEMIERFHSHDYVEQVKRQSETGEGFLDYGDTPAFKGVYKAASSVVGTVLDGIERIMSQQCQRVFVPIAGLHHARRDRAGGFCVFNDCGIAIETLRQKYGIKKIAYVDIDAHHGDGVFYEFEDDPDLVFVDLHEDGNYLYPGTGHVNETGSDQATGTKLNIPMPPGADDSAFMKVWPQAEDFIRKGLPEFILLQCGADSISGDPITHMQYSSKAHAYAAERLCTLANEFCAGRLLAMGGGGYNLDNIARGWNAVVEAMIDS